MNPYHIVELLVPPPPFCCTAQNSLLQWLSGDMTGVTMQTPVWLPDALNEACLPPPLSAQSRGVFKCCPALSMQTHCVIITEVR